MTLEIELGCELPAWSLFWLDSTGAARDFSSGYTFGYMDDTTGTKAFVANSVLVKIGRFRYVVAGVFTANATPTTDSGKSTDIPTLTFAPTAGQLDTLTTGKGLLFVAAQQTSTTKQAAQKWEVIVEDPSDA